MLMQLTYFTFGKKKKTVSKSYIDGADPHETVERCYVSLATIRAPSRHSRRETFRVKRTHHDDSYEDMGVDVRRGEPVSLILQD